MTAESLSFGARIWLAFIIPWKILFDGGLAARVQQAELGALPAPEPEPPPALKAPEPEPELPELEPEAPPPEAPPPEPAEPDLSPAMQILAILQREGRFIDFLQEDVSGFADADIGAAARVVHEGCKRGIDEYVKLKPVRNESEGAAVTLEPGFDSTRTRITGNVVGEPPYNGRLAHHGWLVESLSLPTLAEGHDPRVVAPAEVEL